MSQRPLIAITCSSGQESAESPWQDRLNRAYSVAVAEAGGCPVVAPNMKETGLVVQVRGILLSGGLDVAPGLYGAAEQHPTVEVDTLRDAAELALIQEALRVGVPLLAICRGIQVLNVAMGGTLVQDIPSQLPSAIAHRQKEARHVATHSITIAEDSRLAQIVRTTTLDVNSFHHQALDRVAPGIRPVAWAADGIIEAAESADPRRFVVAVQYHPEEMTSRHEHARSLFRAFVAAAAAHDIGKPAC